MNAENVYDHNFDGVFCTCLRPYPDPDVEVEPEMLQCCICEDWFHLSVSILRLLSNDLAYWFCTGFQNCRRF